MSKPGSKSIYLIYLKLLGLSDCIEVYHIMIIKAIVIFSQSKELCGIFVYLFFFIINLQYFAFIQTKLSDRQRYIFSFKPYFKIFLLYLTSEYLQE